MKPLPILSIGFRPFFLLASIYAVVMIVMWLLTLQGHIHIARTWDLYIPLWHGHEMIFGFTMAVVAGFLLTASANWTGSTPIRSWHLLGLVALWCVGRVSMLMPSLSKEVVLVLDNLFIPTLILSLAPMLIKAGKVKNMAFLLVLAIFAVLNLWVDLKIANGDSLAAANLLYLAVHLVILLIAIIGGRVLPFFTRNGLTQRGHDVEMKVYPFVNELSLLALIAVCAIGFYTEFTGQLFGWVAFMAAGLHLLRLTQWQSHKTLRVPIIWILHLGYLWMVIGLFLEGLSATFGTVTIQMALHALTIGSIGTMILGMMTRVCLGHTGRPIVSLKIVVLSYVVLQLAVLARMLCENLLVDYYREALLASGILWSAAFALFALRYFMILITPRPDGKA